MPEETLLENNQARIVSILCPGRWEIRYYTEYNIAATPLNNAQPWRLFCCIIHKEKGKYACRATQIPGNIAPGFPRGNC